MHNLNIYTKPFLFVFVLTCTFSKVYSQHTKQTTYSKTNNTPQWAIIMYESPDKINEIRIGYEAWRIDNPHSKTNHTQFYKRWMRQAQWSTNPKAHESRIYGERSGSWSEVGPWHYDPEVAMYFEVQSPGACHVYTVEQSYSNPNVIYCGTATAGMYRSSDKGMNWSLITRDLPVTGVYSIAISEIDENLIFLGSGDGDLYRSSNGGASWTICGSSTFQSTSKWYRTLMMTELGLFAATNEGLWFSDDLGVTMQLILAGEYMELERHPTNPNVLYTVRLQGESTKFLKSVDGGVTFATAGIGIGWPITTTGSEQKRTEIAVSPASPNTIYVLAAGETPDGGGLYGYYVSYDAGVTFSQICCGDGPGGPWIENENPNILGWGENGGSDGGQYYYDLALGASPSDSLKQFAAGISVWRTENGGGNWDLNAHWVTWAGEFTAERYTHADVHDIKFFTQSDGTVDMWVASDGGLYYSSNEGDNIEPRMFGLHGTDFWGWQAGWRANNVMIGGTYHNGTLLKNDDLYYHGNPVFGEQSDTSGGWLAELAGDNYRGFVNPGDPSIGYHDNGAFRFSEDRFERISALSFDNSKSPNTSYWLGEYGNYEWDPINYNKFYSPVNSELWRTDNGGSSWTLVHDFGGEKIISISIPPTSPNIIYVSHKFNNSTWKIHKSIDFGLTWTDISLSNTESNFNSDKAIYLDSDGLNPNRIYAVLLGNQNGYSVFESQDFGDSWQNLTTPTLDDEHVISIVHQRGTEGGLYLGTTRAVYYRDDSMEDWELFNDGLPIATAAKFLQPDYCGGTIRTAGPRSVHESPFHSPSTVHAQWMADRTEINLGSPCFTPPIHFSDVSVVECEGAEYVWTFEGGIPSNPTGPDVFITYNSVGEYDVTLEVTDAQGQSSSIFWNDVITVVSEEVVPSEGFSEDFDEDVFPPTNWRLESPGHPWEHAYDLFDETNGVAQFPNYWVETNGALDMLITPGFNPSEIENITFDYAYRQYSTFIDGLQVVGRLAGESEWTVLWEDYGIDLSVADCYTWFWYDMDGEIAWETVSLNTPSHWADTDVNCAEIAFVNVGGYGNHIWIDNVTIGNPVGIENIDIQDQIISISPNPSSGIYYVRINNISNQRTPYYVFDMTGSRIDSGMASESFSLDLSSRAKGLYTLSVPGIGTRRLIKN
ncbi:MAG: hypothetical protein COA49_05660 [Bacteroidetes bacterium]|nr:MAG: hypothetical protein COA49_05660 [Bacteroidota bacterium]